jgi:hypothetical protein
MPSMTGRLGLGVIDLIATADGALLGWLMHRVEMGALWLLCRLFWGAYIRLNDWASGHRGEA